MRRDSTPPRRSGCEVDQVLHQVPVKYAGHLRLFHFRELAEEHGGLVEIDADVLPVLLGHAHAHRRAKSGHRPVLKEPVDDDGIADQIEPAVERKPARCWVDPWSSLKKIENSWSPDISWKCAWMPD